MRTGSRAGGGGGGGAPSPGPTSTWRTPPSSGSQRQSGRGGGGGGRPPPRPPFYRDDLADPRVPVDKRIGGESRNHIVLLPFPDLRTVGARRKRKRVSVQPVRFYGRDI